MTGHLAKSGEDARGTDPIDAEDRRRARRQRNRLRRADSRAAVDAPVMPPPRKRGSSSGEPAERSARNRGERQLRGLESSRGTQVSPTAALRARDWAAPTDEDLAEAEQEVVLVRRHYVPPAPLQSGRRRGRQRGDS